jgi:hypothetical protein
VFRVTKYRRKYHNLANQAFNLIFFNSRYLTTVSLVARNLFQQLEPVG